MNNIKKIVLFSLSFFASNSLFSGPNVEKFFLENGLTILVRPVKTAQKVALQMWYKVGSRDEKTGEKGLAHLIEHMIFKGTEQLSEVDIPLVVNKLSGDCNAATSYDSTHYLFNVARQNWKQILPIMADCMSNCTFKEDLLNSELKAVVQELKMYKDKYTSQLFEKMISTIIPDHPYHFPIIGYKQDLWNLSRNALIEFYKKHYIPNNATLVVVGDVEPQEVLKEAQKHFGSIKPDFSYKKDEPYLNRDLESKAVTIYRDVQQSHVALAFVIPGAECKKDFEFDVLHTVLTGGKNSRLHKLLVDELSLVNWVASSNTGLCDYDLCMIHFEPKNTKDIETVIEHICKQIELIKKEGVTQDELKRAVAATKSDFYSLMESNFAQANAIGNNYLVTGDEEYIFIEPSDDYQSCNQAIIELVRIYFRPTVMHKGFILPMPKEEKDNWLSLQERSDQEDARILSGKIRETELEAPKYSNEVHAENLLQSKFPKAEKSTLKNGIDIFCYHNQNVPKISLILNLKVDLDYEPEELPGLFHLLNYMLEEGGTEHYTAQQFAQQLESRGMSLSISSGQISMSMLSKDLNIGLELLYELVAKAAFDKKVLSKVKEWARADLKRFSNNPNAVAGKIIRENMYKGHPYAKFNLGDQETIDKITIKDLKSFYKKYFSPNQAKLSIVGDLQEYDVAKLIDRYLGGWRGARIPDIEYPNLESIEHKTLNHYMNRDQIYLNFVGHSIDRHNKDFDKLLVFEQIFGRGMNSILFSLREQSGAFYSIHGSLLSGCGKQPGLATISTIVSQDRLSEVKDLISKTIKNAADSITQEQVDEARGMILNSYNDLYSKNSSIASTFLFLDRYDLPENYFETQHETLLKITVEEIKDAVKAILNLEKMMIFQVGRVE